MSERDANDVGGASQSHSQTETSLPDPPSRRPTIIRPASKSFAAVSQNEQVPDSLLTSSSAPLTPGTRPPLVKHRSNEKVKPECPPRPVSTLHSQSGSTSSFKTAGVQPVKKKLEITVVDARPMSENGITSSPSVLYHPTSGTLNFSASAKEEPEKDLPTQYDASLPTNVAGDNANGSGISRKPSGSLKQMKPTIIRQNATRQQPPDVESATEVTVSSLLHPQKIQNLSPVSSPQEPHSIATAAPSATPPPNPKPRTRELTALISDLQKPNQSAADSKPVRPSRPSSSPRSDKKTLVHETTVQASAIKDDLTKAANTSSSNLPPPAPSSAPRQAPPRPLRTPPSLTRKNKDRDQLDGNAQPETKTEKQFAQTRSTDVSNQRESQIDGAGHRRESSETITLPKPKPKPKPKSLTSTSSDCSEEIKSPTHIDNNNSTNKQLLPSNMPIQTTTLNTENSHQEDHLKQNLSLVTTTVDRTGQGDHSSVTEKSKPSSAALNARIESSIKYEKDEKISPTLQSSTKNQRNPSVESPVSLQDTLVPAVFQPPLKTDTNPSINSGVKIKTQVQQKPGSHGSPPLRPVTAAPVRGKSIFASEEHPDSKHPVTAAPVRGKSTFVSEEHPDSPRPVTAAPVKEKFTFVSEEHPDSPRPVTAAPVRGKSTFVSKEHPDSKHPITAAPVRGKSTFVSKEHPDSPRPVTAAPVRGKSTFFSEEHPDSLRLVTAAPVRGKSTFVSEKHPDSPGQASSSSPVVNRHTEPAISRVMQYTTDPPSLPRRPGPGHPLYSYMSMEPHGVAVHDYTASQSDELSFSKGDVVILVKEIDENWMVGHIGDKVGMYPSGFVEVRCPVEGEKSRSSHDFLDSWRESSNTENVVDSTKGPRCRARFDFEGDEEGELTLEDGDIIQITERVGNEWLRGQHRGRQGLFPLSFVEVIEDLPAGSSTEIMPFNYCVSALFDFHGKDGELSFMTGDEITIISQVNSEWLYGQCNGEKGQFPASFVSDFPPDLPIFQPDESIQCKSKQIKKTEPNGKGEEHKGSNVLNDEFWDSRETELGFCRAIFDYTDTSPGDLKFRAGDRIKILEFFGEDWARGRLGNKEGMFPLRFVAEELNSPPRTPEPEVVKKVFGKVLHDFNGETADDLIIKEGDVIEVEDFADINKNWRWGTLDGKRGMFPAEFVEILESFTD